MPVPVLALALALVLMSRLLWLQLQLELQLKQVPNPRQTAAVSRPSPPTPLQHADSFSNEPHCCGLVSSLTTTKLSWTALAARWRRRNVKCGRM